MVPAPLAHHRSASTSAVVPELYYPDLDHAVAWLAGAFGFHERLRVAGHRAQLCNGDGEVVAVQSDPPHPDGVNGTHAVRVRVADVDAHYRRALNAGAHIASPPADYAYGGREYLAVDPGGHMWTFSQPLADHAPATRDDITADAPDVPFRTSGDTTAPALPCPGD